MPVRVASFGARFRRVCVAGGIRASGLLVALLTTGCMTIQGGPDRVYSSAEEVTYARQLLPWLAEQYTTARGSPTEQRYYRNEYVARRMYIIDVEYSEYEAALTGDRQKFGFIATTAATGLGIASTLTTPLRSAQLLSGIGAGILGARGAYDSEIVMAKSLQIVQGHMRAQRDIVATRILPRVNDPVDTYTLSMALHDLEDYYRAGTFTAGLIPALEESGLAAKNAAEDKASVVRGVWGPDASTAELMSFLNVPRKERGRRMTCINDCLKQFSLGPGVKIGPHLDLKGATSARIRLHALQCVNDDPKCSAMKTAGQ
jgi:hypothetical protein